MPLEGEYEPSPSEWVRTQVRDYEASGGREANTLLETGIPVVIVTSKGARSGKIRKTPLMRVERGGRYALVASQGGAPTHPRWYYNLTAHPDLVSIQDGPEPQDFSVRELDGAERDEWWQLAVAVFAPYADYQQRTTRRIPVLLASRRPT